MGSLKMKLFQILVASMILLSQSACLSSPLQGLIFTDTTHYMTSLSSGGQIGEGNVVRRGESCSWTSNFYVCLFYFGGGGSTEEAVKMAGITKIAAVDRKSFSVLGGIYRKECVVVWGE